MSRPTSASINPISGRPAKRVDVVVPIYLNRESLSELVDRIGAGVSPAAGSWQMLFVEDCGNDGSKELLRALAERQPNLRLIEQPQNLGQHSSIARGLAASTADAVIVLDGDLQHQPEDIPRLLEGLERGAEIVIGRAKKKHAGRARAMLNRCWYRISSLFGAPAEAQELVCFSALSRRAVDAYLQSDGCGKLYLAVLLRLGLPTAFCEIELSPRPHGRSSYSGLRLIKLAAVSLWYTITARRKP